MRQISTRRGTYALDEVHLWSERLALPDLVRAERPLQPDERVVTIGSCFAQVLGSGLRRLGLNGSPYPSDALFYSPASIRQELEYVLGSEPRCDAEPWWVVQEGAIVDPFGSYDVAYVSPSEAEADRATRRERAQEVLAQADAVVVTLGLIEVWQSRATGLTFRELPPAAVMCAVAPQFTRQTVSDIGADLERIRELCGLVGARVILTVSPIPLKATFTHLDIRVANSESKARLRAAVSEFVERNSEVAYFPSFEVVAGSDQGTLGFMSPDGRHVTAAASEHVLQSFAFVFGLAKAPPAAPPWVGPPAGSNSHWVVPDGEGDASPDPRLTPLTARAARVLRTLR